MIARRGAGWPLALALTVTLGGCAVRPPAALDDGSIFGTGLDAPPPLAPESEAPPDPEPRWPRGCEAAVERALADHPGPAAAAAALAAAQADARVAITPAPEIRVQAGLPRPEDGGRVGVRIPFPSPGEAAAHDALERARLAAAEADRALVRVELAAAVRHLHLAARRARAAARRTAEAAALADLRRDAAAAQVGAGVLSGVALADARLLRAAVEAERRTAEAEAERAEAALLRLTGHRAADLPCAAPARVEAEPPTVRAARAGALEAEAEAAIDEHLRGFGLEWVEVAWDAVPEDPDRLLMGFAIRLPSLTLAADPVAAHRHAARAAYAAERRRAADEAADARVAWRLAHARLAALEADPARAEAEALLARLDGARALAPEVLSLRGRLLAARAAEAEARFDAEVAAIELRRVLGVE